MSATLKCPVCGKPLIPLTASTLSLTPTCNHDVAKIWLENAKKDVPRLTN